MPPLQAAIAPQVPQITGAFDRPVAIALWQGALRDGPSWQEQLAEVARAAKARGAELLVTPELCVPGFHRFDARHFTDQPADVERDICAIARGAGLALCVGYAERRIPTETAAEPPGDGGADPEGWPQFWNTAVLFDQDGTRCLRYRKHHLWGNEANLGIFASDDDLEVAEISFRGGPAGTAPCRVRVGVLICYDVEYPEMPRILACGPRSAELLLVPTALPYTEPNAALKIVPARAMENRIFVAYCNYPCQERVSGEYFCGHSCIAGPDAEFIAGPLGWAEEELAIGSVGWTSHTRWLASETPYMADRRPAFYKSQGHCQETGESDRDAEQPDGQRAEAV